MKRKIYWFNNEDDLSFLETLLSTLNNVCNSLVTDNTNYVNDRRKQIMQINNHKSWYRVLSTEN